MNEESINYLKHRETSIFKKRDLDFVKKTLLNLGSFGGDGQLLTIQAAKTNKIFVQRQRLPRSFKNRNRNFNNSDIEIKSEKDPFRNT